MNILKKLGFARGNVDPCINVKKKVKSIIVYIAFSVDNNLVVGNVEAIDDAMTALKENGLVQKIMEGLQDLLSCKMKFSMDEKSSWLRQPHLINHLNEKFSKHFKDVPSQKIPGTPKFLIFRPMGESMKISMEDQQEY